MKPVLSSLVRTLVPALACLALVWLPYDPAVPEQGLLVPCILASTGIILLFGINTLLRLHRQGKLRLPGGRKAP